MEKKDLFSFISDILALACLGFIIDHFAGTGYICTGVGAVCGVVVAFVLKKVKEKKKTTTPKESEKQ